MAAMVLYAISNSEYHVKCLYYLNGEYIIHMAFTGEKMESMLLSVQSNLRCGLNLWIRQIETDGEEAEQTM